MKMKPVNLILGVLFFCLAAGSVFYLNSNVVKERAKYLEISTRENDNSSKLLEYRKNLKMSEEKVAELNEMLRASRQELAGKTDMENNQAQIHDQLLSHVSALTRQKSALESQLFLTRQEAVKLKTALQEARNKELVKLSPALSKEQENNIKINSDAAKENNSLSVQISKFKAKSAELEMKVADLIQRAAGEGKLEDENAQLNKVIASLKQEKEGLNVQIDDLKIKISELLAEEEKSYARQGEEYTQHGLYDQAIEVYNKAASIDPNDAHVQLSLGYLYKRAQDDAREAVTHFKRYLLLQPHAKDKREVEYMIEMLTPQNQMGDLNVPG